MNFIKKLPVNEWNDIETPEEWQIEGSVKLVLPKITQFLISASKTANAKNTIDAQIAIDSTSTSLNQKS